MKNKAEEFPIEELEGVVGDFRERFIAATKKRERKAEKEPRTPAAPSGKMDEAGA